jgi:hypothetical protein
MTLLALNQAILGAWASLAPRSFYDRYPLGSGWVAALPPFNEHLVRDVGGLSLGFAVLFGATVLNPNPELVKPALYAWLLPATTHLVFHLDHLHGFSPADAVTQSLGLALAVLVPAAVLLTLHREETEATGLPTSTTRHPHRSTSSKA